MTTTPQYDQLLAELAAGQLTELEQKVLDNLGASPEGLTRYELLERIFGPGSRYIAEKRGLANSGDDRKIREAIESLRNNGVPVVSSTGHQPGSGRLDDCRGKIQAYRPDFSLSGRDLGDAWRYEFVLKSEATRPDLVFIKGSGRPGMSKKFSAGFDAFLLRARDELGLEFPVIARTMKAKDKAVRYRYARLKKSAKDG